MFTPITWVVTEINGHRDKRSSEIMTQKPLKGLNNIIAQIKCHGRHCLSIFCYLVCVILLSTSLKFESFEDRLSQYIYMTVYHSDHLCRISMHC